MKFILCKSGRYNKYLLLIYTLIVLLLCYLLYRDIRVHEYNFIIFYLHGILLFLMGVFEIRFPRELMVESDKLVYRTFWRTTEFSKSDIEIKIKKPNLFIWLHKKEQKPILIEEIFFVDESRPISSSELKINLESSGFAMKYQI